MTFRPRSAPRQLRVALLIGALAMALLLVVDRVPRSIEASGTLDQCSWGWPVVQFDDDDWRGALPVIVRKHPPAYLPVAVWPDGMSYDEAAGELRDRAGAVLFRRGDRVSITGAVIEVHGDPSPCFYIYNLRVDSIEKAPNDQA